ncbi:MAG: O-methyltransferase [Clostridia bacterium]|nr:O-methyltransferase [Clostridia bacterium]
MNKVELEKIKVKALQEHIPIIMDDTLEVIAKILQEKQPKRILEIGTAVGYSAICFSEYLADEGIIDTIERDEERIEEAKKNFVKAEVAGKIILHEGDAVEILPTLNEKYDVVFIDAAKGKYPFFLSEALRMLNDDGIIIADNILYKGYVMSDYNKHKQRTAVRNLREYIKETTENPALDTEILEVGDGLAISRFNNWGRGKKLKWEKGTVLFSHFWEFGTVLYWVGNFYTKNLSLWGWC